VTLVFYQLIAALLIFAISIVTAFFSLRKKQKISQTEPAQAGEAFASGVFLGTALFHLLPDASRLFGNYYPNTSYPLAEAICAGAFLMMLFLERLSIVAPVINTRRSIPYILTFILCIHALTEGAALGISVTLSEVTMLFLAIVAHKASESFALCIALLRGNLPQPRTIMIVGFFALMTPIGIALGSAMLNTNDSALTAAWFNAFAAGTFLYISTLHHVHFHEHTEDAQGLLEFCSLALGVGAMGVIALWA
jgi:zinc transporter 1/2/3